MPDNILGNLSPATAPLVGSEAVPCDQLVGSPVAATALGVGLGYRIVSVGVGTDWQACGVPAGVTAVAGLQFVAIAAGTGTGTANRVATVRTTPDQIAARAAGAIGSAISTHLADPAAHAAAIGAEVAAQISGITHLDAGITGAVSGLVRNNTAGNLPAGTPCRFGAPVGGSDTFDVVVSRGDTPSTLPAAGVLEVALAPGASGHLIRLGPCHGVVTSGMTEGADLWVGPTGGFTTTAPTGLGQRIGSVGKVHAINGSINVAPGPVTSLVARTGAYSDLLGEPELVEQAEAEAGTATTARLWSPLRVRQAATAWWQAVTGSVGRSLAEAATAAAARTTLELGDSATRNVGYAAGTVAAGDAPAAAAAAAVSTHALALPHLSPGGSAGQAQFRNASGGFGGASGLTVDESTGRLNFASFLPGMAPAAPASGFALFADSLGRSALQRPGAYSLTIDAAAFTAARVIAVPDRSGTVALQGDSLGLGGAAPRTGYAATLGAAVISKALIVNAVGSTYSCDIRAASRFMLAAAITGATTIELTNADLTVVGAVVDYVEIEIDFRWTSGIVTVAASGFTVIYDGNTAPTLTSGEIETLICRITPAVAGTPFSTAQLYVAPMRGRT